MLKKFNFKLGRFYFNFYLHTMSWFAFGFGLRFKNYKEIFGDSLIWSFESFLDLPFVELEFEINYNRKEG